MKIEALASRIGERLTALIGEPVEVVGLAPLSGGACQENFRVELSIGGAPRVMCLRSDARTALPGSIGRGVERQVIEAAVEAGVPTPAARWASPGLVRAGADAFFLDWVAGEAIGARVTKHASLASARVVLPEQLAMALAAIHRITPQSHPGLPIERAPFSGGGDPADGAIRFVAEMLDRLPAPRPASELALRWLRSHRPGPGEVVLVHADFRTGNFMVGRDGLLGVLDWEFAHWGDPIEDIGWLCTRDWRFGENALAAGGLCGRGRFVKAYEAASGRVVDRARLLWWEVCGNLRWGVAAAFQGLRYAEGEPDFELLAIPRRAVEMEYEALRLIELAERGGHDAGRA